MNLINGVVSVNARLHKIVDDAADRVEKRYVAGVWASCVELEEKLLEEAIARGDASAQRILSDALQSSRNEFKVASKAG